MVVDPGLQEDTIKDGHLTVATNVHREVCAVSMSGGAPQSPERLLQCTHLAAKKVHDVSRCIFNALKADYDTRGISLHASNIFDKIKTDS
jgi:exosome complex component RRP45